MGPFILGLAWVRLCSGGKGCKDALQIFSGPAQLAFRGVHIDPELVRNLLVLEAFDDIHAENRAVPEWELGDGVFELIRREFKVGMAFQIAGCGMHLSLIHI